jgi:CRP/FNR family transcriptional regulator
MQPKVKDLDWLSAFPDLAGLESTAKALLLNNARIVEASVGTVGYREGGSCGAYVMRLAGQSRVFKMSASGREILLYRVNAGETCVITTTCLLGNSEYPASTVVEEAIKDVIVPSAALISDLIVLLDEVAFHSIDARLAKLLLEAGSDSVQRTHQQIADELGTAREVVSRQVKRLEQKKWVALGRGQVDILDRAALTQLAKS